MICATEINRTEASQNARVLSTSCLPYSQLLLGIHAYLGLWMVDAWHTNDLLMKITSDLLSSLLNSEGSHNDDDRQHSDKTQA